MDALTFRPEPFRNGFIQQETSGGCGCAACRQSELETDDDPFAREADDDDELDAGDQLELEAAAVQLVDVVVDPPSATPSYGKSSHFKNPATTNTRCVDGKERACPVLKNLEDIQQIDGVGFEYIGGWQDKKTKKEVPGIELDKATNRWRVVEKNRLKNRTVTITHRGADGVAAFITNMKAAGLPIEAILTMGSINCRCIANTNSLSDHSFGDAIDIGGVRFVGGQEILVANSKLDAATKKLLHRANACARLSFARVLDYHAGGGHWNHFHCDTNQGGKRAFNPGWKFVRESLGLRLAGGFDKACANALRQFAGNQDAVKDREATDRTLTSLFMREATRS